MEILKMRVADLKKNPRNTRLHSLEQITQIMVSIKEFGFTNPILLKPDNTIIAGHGRLEAASNMAMETVPCIVVKGLNEEQYKMLAIADNKIALNSKWDIDLLIQEINHLSGIEGLDLSVMGFSEIELDSLLNELQGDIFEQPDNLSRDIDTDDSDEDWESDEEEVASHGENLDVEVKIIIRCPLSMKQTIKELITPVLQEYNGVIIE